MALKPFKWVSGSSWPQLPSEVPAVSRVTVGVSALSQHRSYRGKVLHQLPVSDSEARCLVPL